MQSFTPESSINHKKNLEPVKLSNLLRPHLVPHIFLFTWKGRGCCTCLKRQLNTSLACGQQIRWLLASFQDLALQFANCQTV